MPAREKRVTLFTKFTVLIMAVAVITFVLGVVWVQHEQRVQSQREML